MWKCADLASSEWVFYPAKEQQQDLKSLVRLFCKCSLMAWFQPWPGKLSASDRWGAVFHISSCQLSLFWLWQEKCCLLEYFEGGWKKTLDVVEMWFFSLITIRFSILPTQILQQYLLMRNNYVSILSDTSAIVYTKCENLVRHGAYA